LDVKKISEESDYAIADVSDSHDVAGGVKTVMDKFGRIDILVRCLGT
jgi:NAD(P)-dependent dehydrogenase (short-subunit alcohol dehydrogenase family)